MKRLFLSLFLLFSVFLISGCISENIEKVNLYKMESFAKRKEDSLISFTDSKTIKDLSKAFGSAKKEPGIVNMADPDYMIELADKSYFLWINDEQGTIMNVNDTHTIFTLTNKSVKTINRIID